MITFSLKSLRIYPNPGSRARPLAKKPQSQRTKVSCHALGKDSSSLSPQRAVPHPLLVSWARLRALLLAPMLPALVHSVWPVPACQLPALLAPFGPLMQWRNSRAWRFIVPQTSQCLLSTVGAMLLCSPRYCVCV